MVFVVPPGVVTVVLPPVGGTVVTVVVGVVVDPLTVVRVLPAVAFVVVVVRPLMSVGDAVLSCALKPPLAVTVVLPLNRAMDV
jgi:hypothetical protein